MHMLHVTHMIKNVLTKIVQHETYDTHETYSHTSWSHFCDKIWKLPTWTHDPYETQDA